MAPAAADPGPGPTDGALRTSIGQAIIDALDSSDHDDASRDLDMSDAPSEETGPAATDPLALVAASASAETISRELLADAVRSARGAGQSWAAIGDQLGMSRQAAQQRFGSADRTGNDDDRGDPPGGPDNAVERWLGPVTVVDEMAELAEAGRLGWRTVEVGWFKHRVRRTTTQWEHRRTVWGAARKAEQDGWDVAVRAFPWVYLVRDTGRPAADH